jgi:hypothetical protein
LFVMSHNLPYGVKTNLTAGIVVVIVIVIIIIIIIIPKYYK